MPDRLEEVLDQARSRWPAPLPGGFADRVISAAREGARPTPVIVTAFGISLTVVASVASAAMMVAFLHRAEASQPPAVFPADLSIVSR
jgi:hypothetical protein